MPHGDARSTSRRRAEELALSERLVAEINKLIGGRPIAEAVALLAAINHGMAVARAEQTKAAAEHVTVH